MCPKSCPSQNCSIVKKNKTQKKMNLFLWIAAIATLLVALVYGFVSNQANDEELLGKVYPDMRVDLLSQSDRSYKLSSEEKVLYAGLGNAWGYGGNIEVAAISDSLGQLEEVILLANSETLSYIKKLKNKKYFTQYKEKQINEPFVIHRDLDAVTGATITSEAVSRAVRKGGHALAENTFDLVPEKMSTPFKVSNAVIGLVLFFLLALFLFGRSKRLNLLLLAASVLGLGIAWNNSFSISSLSKLFTGGFPSPTEDLTIYVFIVFLAGGIIFLKKNIYCHRICPFFGVQVFLKKLSGLNLRMHPFIMRYEGYVRRFLLWFALIIMFANSNPTGSNFEPFGMIFSLEGHGIQWYILPALIVGSLFSPLFFCRYFCPAGESLMILTNLRKGSILRSKKTKKLHLRDFLITKNNVIPSALYIIALITILSLMIRAI